MLPIGGHAERYRLGYCPRYGPPERPGSAPAPALGGAALQPMCKALVGTMFTAAELLEMPSLRSPMAGYRALLAGFVPDRDISLDISEIEDLQELSAD